MSSFKKKLVSVLSDNLNFHDQNSRYASHNFHSFPAKFPPQLPGIFIKNLTEPGENILDPMAGSGTTVLEAQLLGRRGIGLDIDPLALLITKVKTNQYNKTSLYKSGLQLLTKTKRDLRDKKQYYKNKLETYWDAKTKDFINFWFLHETQIELIALISNIKKLRSPEIRAFFELTFSSIIITKSGGVSLALDLGHTRPHKAKIIKTDNEEVELSADLCKITPERLKILTKIIRPSIDEFEKRFNQNLKGVIRNGNYIKPIIKFGNAQSIPIADNSIDLIVTSPPYASNAIDYMRAHKFTLAWMGNSIDALGQKRKKYIGGESVTDVEFVELPQKTAKLVTALSKIDKKKGQVLHRYYSEMTKTLEEMFRVLKPGKASIVVVGSSVMRGKDTETGQCLAEIGESLGFEVPKIGIRNLDRDKRMLPVDTNVDLESQIQKRMHQESVIGFYKPIK